jgi:hypothetical protein
VAISEYRCSICDGERASVGVGGDGGDAAEVFYLRNWECIVLEGKYVLVKLCACVEAIVRVV